MVSSTRAFPQCICIAVTGTCCPASAVDAASTAGCPQPAGYPRSGAQQRPGGCPGPDFRFVNVHYALLPEYRRRANVNWAIINGESETAITIHVIAPGLDSGNILYQQRVFIGADDTVGDLYAKLNDAQREVLGETIARYISGYQGEPQDEASATYGCTRVPDDGEINWSSSVKQIYAFIRALTPPFPGAHTYLDVRRITILRASPLTNAPRYVGCVPGRVVGRSRQDGYVDVLTGDGVLRIYEVATSDSAKGPASAFIGSTRQTLGLRTADLLAKIELLESRLSLLEDKSNHSPG